MNYNFHEVKTGVLPADVNAPVEEHLKALRSPELDAKLIDIRERKLHGTLYVYDSRTIPIVEADASYGVIPRFHVSEISGLSTIQKPLIIVFKKSVLNKNVHMGKDRGHEADKQ